MSSSLSVLDDVLRYHLCPVRTMVVQDNMRFKLTITGVNFASQLAQEAHEFNRISRATDHKLQSGQAITYSSIQRDIWRTTGRDWESQPLKLRLPTLYCLGLRSERALINIDDSSA